MRSVTAGRIAYTFGLKGPALAVDTACSSSLVTLHVALNSLQAGVCSEASSSGVNLLLMPHTHAMFQVAGMLSPVGRCQTLDAAANGYVRYFVSQVKRTHKKTLLVCCAKRSLGRIWASKQKSAYSQSLN